MALLSLKCRSGRYQPYSSGTGLPTGTESPYNGYKVINPFRWPQQERSKRSWWGPSVFGPPWWAFLPNTSTFPGSVLVLVRTTSASIGIIRHFVGFLARCKHSASEPEARQDGQAAGSCMSGATCDVQNHDHANEVYGLSRFWLSTETGTNPSKQDVTFFCRPGGRTDDIRTVVLGAPPHDTAVDAETGEVAQLARDGESGETVVVHAVRDLTREIVLTQSLYEIDARRQYFSNPARYGHLLRELDVLAQPADRRLIRRLDTAPGAADWLEAIPVDAARLLHMCAAYGFSEQETVRVLRHFSYVQERLRAEPAAADAAGGATVARGAAPASPVEQMDTVDAADADFLTRHQADFSVADGVPVRTVDGDDRLRGASFDADSGEVW